MKYKLIAILLLGVMLLQPLVTHPASTIAGNHVYMTAVIGRTSSKVHIDADTLTGIATGMGTPKPPRGSNYTMNIYFDDHKFQANGDPG